MVSVLNLVTAYIDNIKTFLVRKVLAFFKSEILSIGFAVLYAFIYRITETLIYKM